MELLLTISGRTQRRFAFLLEAARCWFVGWVERNLIAEYPADEDLP